MTFHVGYQITVTCPSSGDEIDATVSFDFYKGYEQTWEEPGSAPEIELCSCLVETSDGVLVDILDQLTTCEVHAIESRIMESTFNDDNFDEPCYEDCDKYYDADCNVYNEEY